MSETPSVPDSSPAASTPSRQQPIIREPAPQYAPQTAPQSAQHGGLPSWPWLLAIVVLLIVTAILATMVVMRATSGLPAAGQQTAPVASTTPAANSAQAEGPFNPDVAGRVADVINSLDPAGFAKDGLFSDPIKVITLSGGERMMSPDDATKAIAFMFESDDTSPWDLHVNNSFRVELHHRYPAFFPESAIIAESHNSLFSFIGHGSVITTVIAIGDEDEL